VTQRPSIKSTRKMVRSNFRIRNLPCQSPRRPRPLPVDLAEHNIYRTDDGDHVGHQGPAHHPVQRL